MRNLLDPEDGENRAVRAFLMHYGAPGLTVKQMRDNMRRAGWEGCWPAWAADVDGHLTKLGAQNWLRHLFALENTAGVPVGWQWRWKPPHPQDATWCSPHPHDTPEQTAADGRFEVRLLHARAPLWRVGG
jgi:hypothetical protein